MNESRLLAALRTAIREVYEDGMDPPEAAPYVRDVLREAGFLREAEATRTADRPSLRRAVRAAFDGGVFDYTFTPEQSALIAALRQAVERDPLNVGQRGFFCTTRGHGLSDWCSVHGDISRKVSISSHMQTEHDLSYDDYRVLEQIDRHRSGVTDEEGEAAERAAGIAAALRGPQATDPNGSATSSKTSTDLREGKP